MKSVGNIVSYFIDQLVPQFDKREVISWAYLSIEHLLGYNRSECILYANEMIDLSIKSYLKEIILDLKNDKPIQYIFGYTSFCDLKIYVTPDTLIPRPETEHLVKWILEEKFSSALDIATGSGCIAVALAKNRDLSIYAIDISSNALQIAKKNAISNNVNVDFLCEDIFKINKFNKVDLIVSNPPYVLSTEKSMIERNVLAYEPHLALFVSQKDPLLFYKQITSIAAKSLINNGMLFFEINEKFADQIIHLLSSNGFVDIELKKDINDKDRMIKAVLK